MATTGSRRSIAPAGLTAGGFYAHFPSKSALLAEALLFAARERRQKVIDPVVSTSEDAALALVERYLSAEHRDSRDIGCPLPPLVSEAGRADVRLRKGFLIALHELVEPLERSLAGAASSRSTALALSALMVGGVALSRAVRGTGASDEILDACRAVGAAIVGSARATQAPQRVPS